MRTESSDAFYDELLKLHQKPTLHRAGDEPVARFLDTTLGLLFPQNRRLPLSTKAEIQTQAGELEKLLESLVLQVGVPADIQELKAAFVAALPQIHRSLQADAQAIHDLDPASKSVDEIIIAYPGFFATATHRIANLLHKNNLQIIPRILSEYAHNRTGVDIHPAATIGDRFAIDHGTGIVIGETSIIGCDVKMFQGVTLGGLSVDRSMANSKRHPTIEDRVVLYANATVLGGSTVVGHDSIIGGNVWLTRSVRPHAKIYHRVYREDPGQKPDV